MRGLSFKVRGNRVAGLLSILALSLGAILAISAIVNAEQLPTRSVTLSSASVAANDVSYAFDFTVNAPAGAFVIDFCSNSPLVGDECVAPAGMTIASSSTATAGFSMTPLDSNTAVITSSISSAAPVLFSIDDVTNPSASGLVYARILTYDTALNAGNYQSNSLGSGTIDGGTVAFSITDTIGVSGLVMESVTFCVSSKEIQSNCGGVESPVLKLGEQMGDVVALTPSEVSEGSMYAQVSTNAAHGVVINLKSNTDGCGGLMRHGAGDACDIEPALDGGISAGQARFGVKVGPSADTGTNPSGSLQPASGSLYNASIFTMNFVTGNTSGITGTFGDPFLDTNGAPANNKNVILTFGASVGNDTPAGLYSADFSMIAVGKF